MAGIRKRDEQISSGEVKRLAFLDLRSCSSTRNLMTLATQTVTNAQWTDGSQQRKIPHVSVPLG
jgi:hypothetical protein